MKLSVCMMVKNEEAVLGKCLESFNVLKSKLKMEIIVLDTGSTDRTADIAKSFTDRVYFKEWNGHYADMRNASFAYAAGEWIFVVDADEYLDETTADALAAFLNDESSGRFRHGSIVIKNFDDRNMTTYSTARVVRLNRNAPGFKYHRAVHEEPVITGEVRHLPVALWHTGYIVKDVAKWYEKVGRYTDLLEKDLAQKPGDVYTLFQLAQARNGARDGKAAFDYVLKAHSEMKKQKLKELQNVYIYTEYIVALSKQQDFEKLKEISLEAIADQKAYRNHLDYHFGLFAAYCHLAEYEKAAAEGLKYVKIAEDIESLRVVPEAPVKTLSLLGPVKRDCFSMHVKAGKYAEAIKLFAEYGLKINNTTILNEVLLVFFGWEKLNALYSFYVENTTEEKREELMPRFLSGIVANLNLTPSKHQLVNRLEQLYGANGFSDGMRLYFKMKRLNLLRELPELSDITAMKAVDFKNGPDYFFELIYALIRGKYNAGAFLRDCGQDYIREGVALVFALYGIAGVMDCCEYESADAHVDRAVYQALLSIDELTLTTGIFPRFIRACSRALVAAYGEEAILADGQEWRLKTPDDLFAYYMEHAVKARVNGDTRGFVDLLAQAVKTRRFLEVGIQHTLIALMQEGYDDLIKEKQASDEKRKALVEAGWSKGRDEIEPKVNELKSMVNRLIEKGDYQQALDAIKQVKALLPEPDPDFLNMECISYIYMMRYAEAYDILTRLHEKDEHNVDTLCNLVFVSRELGKPEDMRAYCEKALALIEDEGLRTELLSMLE